MPSAWILEAAKQGIPQVFRATSEAFLPQAINLDLAAGISFTKGCYPGQEIVARLKYLGKLKQRMLTIRGTGGSPDTRPEPGADVYLGDVKAGSLVYAVTDGPDALYGLAVVTMGKLDTGTCRIGDSITAELSEPDYGIPELSVDEAT